MEKNNNIEKYSADLQRYKDMCRVAERLIDVSMCNGKLISDDVELIEFLNDRQKTEELVKRLKNNSYSDKYMRYIKSADKMRDTVILADKMKQIKRARRLTLLKKVTSVAAVLIAVSVLIYKTMDSSPDQIITYKASHESNIPVIVFDNGEHIDLSNMEDKKKVTYDNLSIADNGKVIYDKIVVKQENEVVTPQYNTVIIPAKHTLDVELSDGTVVKLNANSTLRFPVNFTGDERQVELTGEGYFVVAKSDKPFIVQASNCSVQVYGTAFNVNLNKLDVIETTLVEGSIGFKSENNEEVMLRPNQCLRLNKETNIIDVSEVEIHKNLGWKNGYFFYEQERLIVLLNEISKWHGINIIISNKAAKDIEISINVDRSISLNELLSILENMFKIKFINDGGGRYILI